MGDLYLVTGGCGFIGSHIVDELERQGKQARILDILNDDDICDCDDVAKAMRGVDYVIHQAAIPSVGRSLETPLHTNLVNVEGTLNLLIAAQARKVKRFVYASSSSVYGNATGNPKREDMTPCPASPYAVSKYTGELYCSVYRRLYNLPTVILRYFNVFGPRHQSNTNILSAVIPSFLNAALVNIPIAVDGYGDQTRDFTYVQNVVDANLLACHNRKAIGRTLNIGCGKSTSINTLVGIIEEVTNRILKQARHNARTGDVKHSVACIQKARNVLGYDPKIGLREGLELTWEWMKDQ
jgi:UDP-glucose 4-epimerase